MRIIVLAIASFGLACTDADHPPASPHQRLIALSTRGDTIAKLNGEHCYIGDEGRTGFIYTANGDRQGVGSAYGGILLCVDLP